MDGRGRVLQSLSSGAGGRVPAASGLAFARMDGQTGGSFAAPSALTRILRRRFSRSSVSVPLARRLPSNLGWWLTGAFYTLIGVVGLSQGEQMAAFRAAHGEPHQAIVRMLGFGVERVVMSGLTELHEVEVLQAAGISGRDALPFVDVADLRARLETVPLVKEASVRKLYPDELSIHIKEREPFALWQNVGEVYVIAADGTVIDKFRDGRFAHLPFVVGEDANLRVTDYVALLSKAGELKDEIRAGVLVSGRSWMLKLDNGVDVRLPEDEPGQALARLAEIEKKDRILSKDIIALDLRLPDRVTMRLTAEAAAERLDALKKKPKSQGGQV